MPVYKFGFDARYAAAPATVREMHGATVGAEVSGSPVTLDSDGNGQITLPAGTYQAFTSATAGGIETSPANCVLDIVGSIADGAGGAIGMELIGPITTSFDTPGVGGDYGIGIGPVIPAGSVVLNIWAVCTEEISPTPTDSAIYLGVFPEGDIESGAGVKSYLMADGAVLAGPVIAREMQDHPQAALFPFVASTDIQTSITWWPGEGAFVSGSVDVYVLTGQPV